MRQLLFAALVLITPWPAAAQVPMVGLFEAQATCSATPSIRDPERNPGDIATQAGETYDLLGRNAVPGSHYLIRVPGAEPEQRWVAYGCGVVVEDGTTGPVFAAMPGSSADALPMRDDFVLAASWQPAFCETRPRVPECADGARDDRGFTLHGLWPQPRGRDYCDVPTSLEALDRAGRWLDLPALDLRPQTRAALEAAMPGVRSGLHRHEWIKHGTCFAGDAERYFAVSLALLAELNASPVRELFERSVGERLSANEIRRAFDKAFGRGSGERVLVDCDEPDGRRLIVELRLSLSGTGDEPLAQMLIDGETAPHGCRAGEVDPAGFG